VAAENATPLECRPSPERRTERAFPWNEDRARVGAALLRDGARTNGPIHEQQRMARYVAWASLFASAWAYGHGRAGAGQGHPRNRRNECTSPTIEKPQG